MVVVGTIGLGGIPPWPHFADFLGQGLLKCYTVCVFPYLKSLFEEYVLFPLMPIA